MEFKLLGSGDGGGGDSMGNVFSQGVPTLDNILGASRDFIQGGLDLAGTRMQTDATANREFMEAQMKMNAQRRAESQKRLLMKQENEGTLASMLGEYDTILEAMSASDDEETQSMIPLVMMGRARLMQAAQSNAPAATLRKFLEQEQSSGMSPSKRSAQAAQEAAQRQTPEEPKAEEKPSAEKTKSPPAKTTTLPSSRPKIVI